MTVTADLIGEFWGCWAGTYPAPTSALCPLVARFATLVALNTAIATPVVCGVGVAVEVGVCVPVGELGDRDRLAVATPGEREKPVDSRMIPPATNATITTMRPPPNF